ncbi:FAD-binding oxidoreductase [Ferrimonas pelagia]|uniref:NQR complex subunit F n=1 Tax=Ferrimonas pelagia TaxID=1177826 RepID=A0ABP9F5I7_9GAMM
MPKPNQALTAVTGYQQALDLQQQLAEQGTDLSELRGNVAQQLAQLHPKRLSLRVDAIIDETPSTRTLRVSAATGSLPNFQSGQYINLFVTVDGTETARPFSIASAPEQRSHYDLTIKRMPNGFVSHHMQDQIKVGDTLQSSGPMGAFFYNPVYHGKTVVFLAGGSGIAPARSMLNSLIAREAEIDFHLLYASQSADDVIFGQELEATAQAHANIQVHQVISRPSPEYTGLSGHLSAELMQRLLPLQADPIVFICGPTGFNEHCQAQLNSLGIANRRIRVEANGTPNPPQQLASWPEGLDPDREITVSVQGRGQFKAKIGEPLLNSLERNGYQAENACRSGECSLCRVKLLSGDVFNPPQAKLRKSDRQFGWIHSCVAFPTEDIEILL